MEKKWTPGPWRAFYKSKYNEWHVNVPIQESNMRLALFEDGIKTSNPEEDSNLIAAAPELYEALESCEYWLSAPPTSNSDRYCVSEAIKRARAVLAKARGEQ